MRVQPTKVRKIANKFMASYHTLNPGISWLPGHKKKTNCYSNWAFCISCYFQIMAFSELLSSLFDGQIGQWVWPNCHGITHGPLSLMMMIFTYQKW